VDNAHYWRVGERGIKREITGTEDSKMKGSGETREEEE
jgi:hypothetical protein